MTDNGRRLQTYRSRSSAGWVAAGMVTLASLALLGASCQAMEPEPTSVPTVVPNDAATLTALENNCALGCSSSNLPPGANPGTGGVTIISVQETTDYPSSGATVTSINGTPVAEPAP
jgi:hypothetical protein